MKYYTSYAETYHNGQLIGTQNGGHCLTENELPKEETFALICSHLGKLIWNVLQIKFNVRL